MKRSKLVIVFFVVLVTAAFSPFTSVSLLEAQDKTPEDLPIIAEFVPEMRQQGTTTSSHTFLSLDRETFLKSDGSAVRYIDNWIRNDISEPMDSHTECIGEW